MPATARRTASSVLAIEHETRGTTPLSPSECAKHDVVVIAQHPAEPLANFARRVVQQIAALAADTGPLAGATLACNSLRDDEHLVARGTMAMAMALGMRGAVGGRIVLTATAGTDAGLQHQLLAIAGTLMEQGGAKAPTVAVVMQPSQPRDSSLIEEAVPTEPSQQQVA